MPEQPSLFSAPAVRNHDGIPLPALPYAGGVGSVAQETSRAAAEAMKVKAGSLQAKVILLLDQYGPLSDETIDRLAGAVKPLRPRRAELTKATEDRPAYVRDSGDTCTGSSGLQMITWELTPDGAKLAEQIKKDAGAMTPASK